MRRRPRRRGSGRGRERGPAGSTAPGRLAGGRSLGRLRGVRRRFRPAALWAGSTCRPREPRARSRRRGSVLSRASSAASVRAGSGAVHDERRSLTGWPWAGSGWPARSSTRTLVAARPADRVALLGVLRGDARDGHGGDEQGQDQAADRAERGPRVVGQPAGGDQRAGAAGAPGHDPRAGHRQPWPGDDQADHDQQEAGQERLDLPGNAGRAAVHDEEAELGQAGQQREHPPGPRRLRGHPAGDAERGNLHPPQRQPGHHGGRHRHADRDRQDVRAG